MHVDGLWPEASSCLAVRLAPLQIRAYGVDKAAWPGHARMASPRGGIRPMQRLYVNLHALGTTEC